MSIDHQPRTRGRKWMRLRHVVLVEEPLCMICRRAASVEVDHIIPITKGGTDERDNLQGVCAECHEEKTRKDLGLKAKPQRIGVDGYPIGGDNGETYGFDENCKRTDREGKKSTHTPDQ